MDANTLKSRLTTLRSAMQGSRTPAYAAATQQTPATQPASAAAQELFPIYNKDVDYRNMVQPLVDKGLIDPSKLVRGYGDDTTGIYSPYRISVGVPEEFMTRLGERVELAPELSLAGGPSENLAPGDGHNYTPGDPMQGLSWWTKKKYSAPMADYRNVYTLPGEDGATVYDWLPTASPHFELSDLDIPNLENLHALRTRYGQYKDRDPAASLLRSLSDPIVFHDPETDSWQNVGTYINYFDPVKTKHDLYTSPAYLGVDDLKKATWVRPESGRQGYIDWDNLVNEAVDMAGADIGERRKYASENAIKKQSEGSWAKKNIGKLGPALSVAAMFMPTLAPLAAGANLAGGVLTGNPAAMAAGFMGLPGVGNAVTGGISSGLQGLGVPAAATPALTGALTSGVLSDISGGNFWQGALSGAVAPGIKSAFPSLNPQQLRMAQGAAKNIYKYARAKNKDPKMLLGRLAYLLKPTNKGA